MSKFEIIIPYTLANEGGDALSLDPYDTGNWTGGAMNVGTLNGSKYGISAASYPTLDIKNLTQDEAEQIYLTDFWNKIGGELLPTASGFLLFDACVNSGTHEAVEWMQTVLGFTGKNVDGDCGEITQKAISNYSAGQQALCLQFGVTHLMAITGFNNWSLYKHEYITRSINNSAISTKLLSV